MVVATILKYRYLKIQNGGKPAFQKAINYYSN